MRPTSSVLTILLILVQYVPADAQERPNFAGRWILDADASKAAGGPPPLCFRECVITQTAAVLTFKSEVRSVSYKLDGVAVTETVTTSGQSSTMTTTASWDGDAVVIKWIVKGTSGNTPARSTVSRCSIQKGRMIISGTRSAIDGSDVKFEYQYRAQ